jgi:hypothetical protein
MGDQPIERPISTQNKRTQTSMPRVGFEPPMTVFERAKTVHALDRTATVIVNGYYNNNNNNIIIIQRVGS